MTSTPHQGSVRSSAAPAQAAKLKVFISYSRDDLKFADQLDAALDLCGFECTLDRQGISGGEDWRQRLSGLIRDADTVAFVLSPASAQSETCGWEVGEAARLGKRILPVLCRSLEGKSAPPLLQQLNYIYFYDEPDAPGSGFGYGLARLVSSLNTDLDWLREHTRYLQRASEWEAGGRPVNRLLSGADIAEAKAWVARRPKAAPELTALHLDFIRESEEEEAARSNAQRQQLASVAAAQAERETALQRAEAALKEAAEAQRKRTRARSISFAAVSVVAVIALLAGWQANKQRKEAEIQRAEATEKKERAQEILSGATILIGKLYRQSKLDDDSLKDARAIFESGAALGDGTVMSLLGAMYFDGRGVERDFTKAREWLEKAALKGNTAGMLFLGMLYQDGQGGERDYDKARQWYEKAAAANDATSMNNLGRLYESGRGVAQDYVKAREWYEMAAAQGSATAMNDLGGLYHKGAGVPKDLDAARSWFEKAAAQDSGDAMSNLGVLYHNGTGVARDFAKAREWYEKAIAKGNSGAMNNLAALYENGQGIAKNAAKARELYEKAAALDNPDAKVNLERTLLDEAATAGRYGDALKMQEAIAARVEAGETENAGKPGKQTADKLVSVSWFALLARDYAKALAVSLRAHAINPEDISIDTNRAHALLFLERTDEARALYLLHKGKSEGDRTWESVIAQDFAEFRKAGLTHPLMRAIETELGSGPPEPNK